MGMIDHPDPVVGRFDRPLDRRHSHTLHPEANARPVGHRRIDSQPLEQQLEHVDTGTQSDPPGQVDRQGNQPRSKLMSGQRRIIGQQGGCSPELLMLTLQPHEAGLRLSELLALLRDRALQPGLFLPQSPNLGRAGSGTPDPRLPRPQEKPGRHRDA